MIRWEDPISYHLHPAIDELRQHPGRWGVVWEEDCGDYLYGENTALDACRRHPRVEHKIEYEITGARTEHEHRRPLRLKARYLSDEEFYALGGRKRRYSNDGSLWASM